MLRRTEYRQKKLDALDRELFLMKANDKHLSAKETIKKLDDIFAQKQEIRNSEDAEDDNTENFDAKGSLTKQVGELKNKLYSINKDMVVLESNDN